MLAIADALEVDGYRRTLGGSADVHFPMIASRDIGKDTAEALLPPPVRHDAAALQRQTPVTMPTAAHLDALRLHRHGEAATLPLAFAHHMI